MSSVEEDELLPDETTVHKKRRLQNACDICRKKKIKCDSANRPGNRCSNCIAFDSRCTHTTPARRRGPKNSYVEQLEKRVEEMEKALKQLQPSGQLLKNNSESVESAGLSTMAVPAHSDPGHSNLGSPVTSPPSENSPESLDHVSDEDDDLQHIGLHEQFGKMDIQFIRDRYFGASSGFMLLHNAIQSRSETSGPEPSFTLYDRQDLWELPWERQSEEMDIYPQYKFPPTDLARDLFALYFHHSNTIFPLVHEPTFRDSFASGLHLRKPDFAGTVLLVCAIGSRLSNDPRVLVKGTKSLLSAGWVWYDQVRISRKSMLKVATLSELQVYGLSIIYILGTSAPQASWTAVSVGLRYCMEIGLHRRKSEGYKMTVDDHIKIRVFWVLWSLDVFGSSFVGRPVSLRDEDFDTELPLEVDDEYWYNLDPSLMFKQPPNKPSYMSFFTSLLRLNEILSFSSRTIYAIKKSKKVLGLVNEGSEQDTLMEIDSALNQWADSVPDHLRWDPQRQNSLFFDQSAILFSTYYSVQIQAHRPFIHKPSSLAFSSLAICANAARTCSHIVEAQVTRGSPVAAQSTMAAFMSGVVLLINIWGGRKAGLRTNTRKDMADVGRCIRYLKYGGQRWNLPNRFLEMLRCLAESTQDDEHLEDANPARKRARDDDAKVTSEPSVLETGSIFAQGGISSAEPTSSLYGCQIGQLPVHETNPEDGVESTTHVLQADLALRNMMGMGGISNDSNADFSILDDLSVPMGIWTNAPVSFSLEEWGTYIANMTPNDFFPEGSTL